ncbi:Putative teichuronic acid biosynthesis glycosyltransferase TuaC [Stieleria maiorica]|uniref:Teichuronic acid biosynthesis glycosyltransferase TuaC n=1 Tax=Stieleria maiorica TaxID=2795974 RepID=A0A5B9MGJ4_9BACT|nr:glycosyltransferase [Stieleria maiorica]QEF99619.1 Putative teichuronic acid biosynthesis glycosyltransferase TuaC [Stieleria maiorica]
MTNNDLKVLVVSAAFPSTVDPTRGIFVYERIRALSNLPGVSVRVISPTPWAPGIRSIPKFEYFSKLPNSEVFHGITVDRPRYPLPPKIGGYFHPQLMSGSLLSAARRIHTQFQFDLVDAHWVYPSGAAAAKVARQFNVPVCMTGRGEDMTRFPSMPMKGKSIRRALRAADALIGVSRQISQAMIQHGAEAERVTTIANGVDIEKFRPLSSRASRQRLGLPTDRKILLTVGDRLALKGFHVVIESLPQILQQHPDAMYVCVGGPGRHGRDYSDQIQALIQRLGLQDRVMIAGPQDHDSLVDWYNSADLYVLASSREGSPNVLLEALACGTPAVATTVGGATDEVIDGVTGFLMEQRTSETAANVITKALGRTWDRQAIRAGMEQRSWAHTAHKVMKHWEFALAHPTSRDEQVVTNG